LGSGSDGDKGVVRQFSQRRAQLKYQT